MTTSKVPGEIISRTVDCLWDHIILCLDSRLFLNLLLVNKTFHLIVGRRRIEFMRAYAVVFNTNATKHFVQNYKKPLSNALVDPCALLYGLCNELGCFPFEKADRLAQHMASFVLRNHERFDSLINTFEYPVMFQNDEGDMSFSSVQVKEVKQTLHHHPWDPRVVLIKNVAIYDDERDSVETWPYAVMLDLRRYCEKGRFYVFKTTCDDDLDINLAEVKVVRFLDYDNRSIRIFLSQACCRK
ncbi:hypothetical protein DFJ77DRAFT_457550 [Powellomyces hirtus]|nr:hypothetical protein DFJ77DRAFT_457550 [Powellomyces hirtus]